MMTALSIENESLGSPLMFHAWMAIGEPSVPLTLNVSDSFRFLEPTYLSQSCRQASLRSGRIYILGQTLLPLVDGKKL